jgi:hypothetical protein
VPPLLGAAAAALQSQILPAGLADEPSAKSALPPEDVAIVGPLLVPRTARLLLGACGMAEVVTLHVLAVVNLKACIRRRCPRRAAEKIS